MRRSLYGHFKVKNLDLAIPVEDICEVYRFEGVLNKVPLSPHYLQGVISVREFLIPVVDLGVLLGDDKRQVDCCDLVILKVNGNRIALIVDFIGQMIDVERLSGVHVDKFCSEERLFSGIIRLSEDRNEMLKILKSSELVKFDHFNEILIDHKDSHSSRIKNDFDFVKLVTFFVQDQIMSFSIADIYEVCVVEDFKSVGSVEYPALVGKFSLRDNELFLLDLNRLLNPTYERLSSVEGSKAIIINVDSILVGIIVSDLKSIETIERKSIKKISLDLAVSQNGLYQGIIYENGLKNISLDINRLRGVLRNIHAVKEQIVLFSGEHCMNGRIGAQKQTKKLGEKITLLEFSLGESLFVKTEEIQEIVSLDVSILTRPFVEDKSILGILELRGDPITVVDLRQEYTDIHDPLESSSTRKILIVNSHGLLFGFVVDDLIAIRYLYTGTMKVAPKLYYDAVEKRFQEDLKQVFFVDQDELKPTIILSLMSTVERMKSHASQNLKAVA